MADISLYGDLKASLESVDQIKVSHTLESMKILSDTGDNDPELYGFITSNSVSNLYIEKPNIKGILCMAVSTDNYNILDGRPSSWSAAIDNSTSGAIDEIHKLFIISAGNIRGPKNVYQYPTINQTESIEDPGQFWNAITVGAYTNLDKPSDPIYELVAKKRHYRHSQGHPYFLKTGGRLNLKLYWRVEML